MYSEKWFPLKLNLACRPSTPWWRLSSSPPSPRTTWSTGRWVKDQWDIGLPMFSFLTSFSWTLIKNTYLLLWECDCRCSHCICLVFSCSFHFLICSKNIFKELQFLIQLLDPEQQGWAAVPQAEGQLWDCQRGRSAGLSSVSNQFYCFPLFLEWFRKTSSLCMYQVLEVCQEVTELNLTDWRARIEGREVEILPEVTSHQSCVELKR